LDNAQRDQMGYIIQADIGGATLSGEELRTALSLPSSCFYCKEVDGQVRIVTKGVGHGVGMSQFGANSMAAQGKDYREILETYFGKSLILSAFP
jgi:stage II sporulation protein D